MDATVTMTGTGSASAAPDAVRLMLAARTTAGSVSEALRGVSSGVRALGATAREHGVPDAGISTRGLNLWPQHSRDGDRVTGYQASHAIEVRCDGLDAAGSLLSALAEELGNDLQVDSVEPVVSDPSALAAQAREQAFAQARDKAAQLAALAGQSLGAVVTITEEEGRAHPGDVRLMAMSAESGASFEAGSTAVTASLRVTWRLVSG